MARSVTDARDEYCSIVLHHLRVVDEICDGTCPDVYEHDGYMLPSQLIDIYGDVPEVCNV